MPDKPNNFIRFWQELKRQGDWNNACPMKYDVAISTEE